MSTKTTSQKALHVWVSNWPPNMYLMRSGDGLRKVMKAPLEFFAVVTVVSRGVSLKLRVRELMIPTTLRKKDKL